MKIGITDMKRVVITGLGVVSPLGIGQKDFWENVVQGKSGLSKIEELNGFQFEATSFGYVRDFEPSQHGLLPFEIRRTDRVTQFGIISSTEAINDSGLDFNKIDPTRVGINIANAVAGTKFMDEEFAVITDYGNTPIMPEDVSVYSYSKSMPNSTSNEISYKYGFQGPCNTLATGCTAGIDSMGFGYDLIRSGDLDVFIAGGTEAPITPITIAAFQVIYTLSTLNDPPEKASRPFDKARNGFVLGEGAGIFVLEEMEHAMKRGAKIYGEVVGYSSVNNAIHMTGLHPEGLDVARSIELALDEAKINRDDVDYINAHGSGTKQNDISETGAYKRVFGKRAYDIPISSSKSMLGHSLGAATGVELAVCCLSLQNNFVPPTINYSEKDELCDLDYVPNVGREKELDVILKDASGFSGIHSAIVLRKFKK